MVGSAVCDGVRYSTIYQPWSTSIQHSILCFHCFSVTIVCYIWNDFLWPLLYLNDESLYTLQIGLQVFKGQVATQWNYMMAGSLIVLFPVVVFYRILVKVVSNKTLPI